VSEALVWMSVAHSTHLLLGNGAGWAGGGLGFDSSAPVNNHCIDTFACCAIFDKAVVPGMF